MRRSCGARSSGAIGPAGLCVRRRHLARNGADVGERSPSAVHAAAFIAEGVVFLAVRASSRVRPARDYDPGALLLAGEVAIGLALPWLLLRPRASAATATWRWSSWPSLAAVAIEPVTASWFGAIADRLLVSSPPRDKGS